MALVILALLKEHERLRDEAAVLRERNQVIFCEAATVQLARLIQEVVVLAKVVRLVHNVESAVIGMGHSKTAIRVHVSLVPLRQMAARVVARGVELVVILRPIRGLLITTLLLHFFQLQILHVRLEVRPTATCNEGAIGLKVSRGAQRRVPAWT